VDGWPWSPTPATATCAGTCSPRSRCQWAVAWNQPTSRPAARHATFATAASDAPTSDSQLAIARGLREETAATSLGEVLALGSCDEDDLYAAMDYLQAFELLDVSHRLGVA
jgi:hypothetical protein